MSLLKLGQATNKNIINEVNESVKKSESNEVVAINTTDNVNSAFIKGKLPNTVLANKDYSVNMNLLDSNNVIKGQIGVTNKNTEYKVGMELFDSTGANPKKIEIKKDNNNTIRATAPQPVNDQDDEIATIKFVKDNINDSVSQIVSARFPKILEINTDYTLVATSQANGNLDKGAFEVTFTNPLDGGIIALNQAGEQVVFSINWDLTVPTKPKLGKCYVDTNNIKFLTFVTKVI